MEGFRLLSIHAHPDDEASKGAATVAKYSDAGVQATLVCATGGEEGDILNEAVNTPEVRADLPAVRMRELKAATDIIGYATVEMLGYRDSGMKDSDSNKHPECFWAAPVVESSQRFAELLRKHRPHVVISYGDPMGGYDHPDHVRVWEITDTAINIAASADAAIDGEPWQVLKLYNSIWSRQRMRAMHEKFEELGMESPFDNGWFERPGHDHLITTRIECAAWYERRANALLAHETQVDPTSKFWFGLPDEAMREINHEETFRRMWSRVSVGAPGEVETDLFAGIETEVR
ncbi:MAG: PIG-L family deacetylase [Actinomycetota bacterium]